MKRNRMTKTDRRRQLHRANATTYFQSNSDGMRLYYRGRRPDAFIRRLRKREFTTIDQLIAEHEKDAHIKALLDEARADLKKRIAEAGGLEYLIEVGQFALQEPFR